MAETTTADELQPIMAAENSDDLSSGSQSAPAADSPKPESKLNHPLAAQLPPEMADFDVREWYPEFRPGQVLRFSRLFKLPHLPHIWRRKKKKKIADVDTSDEQKTVPPVPPVLPAEDGAGMVKSDAVGDAEGDAMEYDDSFIDEPSFELNMGRSPKPEEIAIDDKILFLQPETFRSRANLDSNENIEMESKVADWRYGPAQLWYDMLGVDDTGKGFDYGFKKKEDTTTNNLNFDIKNSFAPGAFQMVTQIEWEDDIIWNAEDAKTKVFQSLKQKGPAAGWIPSINIRTVEQYKQQFDHIDQYGNGDVWYSIFPAESDPLVNGNWEDDIIWDAEAMDKIPEPKVLTLDQDDENLILEIPDDVEKPSQEQQEPVNKKEKEGKKSKNSSGKAKEVEEQEEESTIQNKDPFNLSNDEYYNPKLTTENALGRNLGCSVIQHSTPAVELRQPFFPSHHSVVKLRNFHRPMLKKYLHGLMMSPGPHPVLPLQKQIARKEKMREQDRQASGGGEMFFMRTPEDLTGKDGELILAEYSEQYPPLINQVGMATKIKNYYKRTKEVTVPQFTYGELAYAHTSPFLGSLVPGQVITAFENNMFRAPIYQHKMPESDFLIIRNRMHYYIREINVIFAVGQECPLIDVPGPSSKRSNNFIRDFLMVFIYRLFWKSKDVPRKIKMEEIRKAFPTHSESSIRKRLKLCADFKRTGYDSNCWVLKSNFRLPTEEEIREMVSPEQCCAYYSMLAAEQRLKDAGYGEKSLFAPDDENNEETQTKMEDEVKAAPWNTTRSYIDAVKGRCLLDLNGVADPTGCGEGFSYIKIPNKPQVGKDDTTSQVQNKRTITGTDADLRRLPLKEAKNLLRKYGVTDDEIKKLGRWEVISLVRTMSTEQAKAAQDDEVGEPGISKFARGNRFSMAEHQVRYKEECQRIFDLQNRILGSDEILSTDEDSSSGEDTDFEEMGKNIENMLSNKKTCSQISMEREEAERMALNRMLKDDSMKDKNEKKKVDTQPSVTNGTRKLKITRIFQNEDGGQFTRTEIVSDPNVIDTYVRIRETKDPLFIRQTFTDDQLKEDMKKEKRRLQEQLRRIKRNQKNNDYSADDTMTSPPTKKMKRETTPIRLQKLLKSQKLKCGACGQLGHMRRNMECPMFNKSIAGPSGGVAMTEEQEEQLEKTGLVDRNLVNVEGTKVTLSKQVVEHAEIIKRKSLMLKLPKIARQTKKRKKNDEAANGGIEKRKAGRLPNRRRADPVVTLSSMLERVLNEMRELPEAREFLYPVNVKHVADYNRIIQKPMDLQTIRENLHKKKYISREAFLIDVGQIVSNCELYNGLKSSLTAMARRVFDFCIKRLAEKEDALIKLEKAINPLLDDDDMVSLSYILTSIVEERMKTVEGSIPFHTPVNKKKFKDYYDMISRPMDLSTLQKNALEKKYRSREQFLNDVELIVTNCQQYNGMASLLTQTAVKLFEVCKQALEEQEETLQNIEDNLRAVEQAALDAVDTVDAESITTGMSEPSHARLDTDGSESEQDQLDEQSRLGSELGISQYDQFHPSESEDISQMEADLDTSQNFELQLDEPDPSNAFSYDENAQDYDYSNNMLTENDQVEDEDFDPQAFFDSVLQSDNYTEESPSKSNQNQNANVSDLNNDLQLSDSDVDVEESDQEFNMNEFLKPDST